MKKTTRFWPVAYLSNSGEQVNTVMTFDPSKVCPDHWVGEPVELSFEYPDTLGAEAVSAKIKALSDELNALLAKEKAQ